jgi:uncharacterized membrane protein YraQ (UPF0718 family)
MKRQKVILILHIIILIASVVNIVDTWGDTVSQIGAWLIFASAVLGIINMWIQLRNIKTN